MAFREINWYVRDRLKQHLRRRSQRFFRPPEGVSYYEHLNKLRLASPVTVTAQLPANACDEGLFGEPDAGNPHVRFDEGERSARRYRPLCCSTKRLFDPAGLWPRSG